MKRLIASILIDNGLVVRREGFKTTSIIGRPEITIKYLQSWNVDEIMFINVGKKDDISYILKEASSKCFLPLTVGGSISNIEEVHTYMKQGADKVVIGKHANKELLSEISNHYGDQAVCLSIDKDHYNIHDWPCGEIIMHDIDRDGRGEGLNLDILKQDFGNKNVIAMGGVGNYNHIVEGLTYCNAVAVGNLFHFKEISAIQAKELAKKTGFIVR